MTTETSNGAQRIDAPPRVAIFVDCENLSQSVRLRLGGQLDYLRLIDRLIGERELVDCVAYVLRPVGNRPLAYEAELADVGIKVRTREKRPSRNGPGYIGGCWDVGLAVDAVRLASTYDVAIICSGQGSLVELVFQLKEMGKQIEVVGVDGSISGRLWRAAHAASLIGAKDLMTLVPDGAKR